MTRKRNFGRAAAIGGLTATIALLTRLPVASADELADLRANQELLQRRIEQLAQGAAQGRPGVPGAYGAEAHPGEMAIQGSFPRSFLIPGTDTSIRVGGFIDETLDYYFVGAQPNGNQTTTIGVTGQLESAPLNTHAFTQVSGFPTPGNLFVAGTASARGNGNFSQSPRETRLNVETRTPTAWGESRTFIEFDFAGSGSFSSNNLTTVSDSLIPRLRYAYGTLGGFLAGQANSNFSDPDANPETLDFGGPAGFAGVTRIPQVRYTLNGPWGSAWSVSAETPETDIVTPAGNVKTDTNLGQNPVTSPTTTGCVANGITISATAGCALAFNPTKSSAPDLTFASYWAQSWGHVDFRGLVRPTLTLNDGRFVDRTFVGGGGGISGDVKPGWFGWEKDDFQFQFTVGNGIGRYINESNNAALATNFLSSPATPAAAASIIVKPIFEYGYALGYQHFWLPNLRSTAVYGYADTGYPTNIIGPTQGVVSNRVLQTAHINLIWSPVAFIDAGVEYFWGQRQTASNNIKGDEQTLISKFRVKF
jgi:hypothetical protein